MGRRSRGVPRSPFESVALQRQRTPEPKKVMPAPEWLDMQLHMMRATRGYGATVEFMNLALWGTDWEPSPDGGVYNPRTNEHRHLTVGDRFGAVTVREAIALIRLELDLPQLFEPTWQQDCANRPWRPPLWDGVVRSHGSAA